CLTSISPPSTLYPYTTLFRSQILRHNPSFRNNLYGLYFDILLQTRLGLNRFVPRSIYFGTHWLCEYQNFRWHSSDIRFAHRLQWRSYPPDNISGLKECRDNLT